jgi:CheY-like chemotaxis protein
MPPNSPDSTINILLVEDDEVDVLNVQRAFKKNNITNPLYIAGNGLEALDMLRGINSQSSVVPAHRRLILLDLNMPRMNGIEFLQELRADPNLKSIPVVVLTTSEGEQDRVEASQLNVAGYLLKPVKFSEFVELMAVLNKYWMLSKML